jgi:hypothetical protein
MPRQTTDNVVEKLIQAAPVIRHVYQKYGPFGLILSPAHIALLQERAHEPDEVLALWENPKAAKPSAEAKQTAFQILRLRRGKSLLFHRYPFGYLPMPMTCAALGVPSVSPEDIRQHLRGALEALNLPPVLTPARLLLLMRYWRGKLSEGQCKELFNASARRQAEECPRAEQAYVRKLIQNFEVVGLVEKAGRNAYQVVDSAIATALTRQKMARGQWKKVEEYVAQHKDVELNAVRAWLIATSEQPESHPWWQGGGEVNDPEYRIAQRSGFNILKRLSSVARVGADQYLHIDEARRRGLQPYQPRLRRKRRGEEWWNEVMQHLGEIFTNRQFFTAAAYVDKLISESELQAYLKANDLPKVVDVATQRKFNQLLYHAIGVRVHRTRMRGVFASSEARAAEFNASGDGKHALQRLGIPLPRNRSRSKRLLEVLQQEKLEGPLNAQRWVLLELYDNRVLSIEALKKAWQFAWMLSLERTLKQLEEGKDIESSLAQDVYRNLQASMRRANIVLSNLCKAGLLVRKPSARGSYLPKGVSVEPQVAALPM